MNIFNQLIHSWTEHYFSLLWSLLSSSTYYTIAELPFFYAGFPMKIKLSSPFHLVIFPFPIVSISIAFVYFQQFQKECGKTINYIPTPIIIPPSIDSYSFFGIIYPISIIGFSYGVEGIFAFTIFSQIQKNKFFYRKKPLNFEMYQILSKETISNLSYFVSNSQNKYRHWNKSLCHRLLTSHSTMILRKCLHSRNACIQTHSAIHL